MYKTRILNSVVEIENIENVEAQLKLPHISAVITSNEDEISLESQLIELASKISIENKHGYQQINFNATADSFEDIFLQKLKKKLLKWEALLKSFIVEI